MFHFHSFERQLENLHHISQIGLTAFGGLAIYGHVPPRG
jgi:hypothetical protein